jgi:hypothetical protein
MASRPKVVWRARDVQAPREKCLGAARQACLVGPDPTALSA